jgi:HK97 family phage portal protein
MVTTEVFAGPGGVFEQAENAYSSVSEPAEWFVRALGGTAESDESGVEINETTVLTHGPVWQAVNVLAGDVGLIPFNVRRRLPNDDGWKIDERHPVHQMLNYRVNYLQTPSLWKEWAIATRLIWGNAVSEKVYDGRGNVVGANPLPPQLLNYTVDEETGQPYYYMAHPRLGFLTWEVEDVIHFRGLTSDGFWGYRLAQIAAGVVGHGLALRKHGNKTFKNGARPGGVLQHPNKLPKETREQLREEWHAVHGGVENAGKIAVLWEGMTFNPYTISNHDAQWLEAMRLDREQIAGLFNLPPHKLGALENAAVRANLEEQNREYYNTSLARIVNGMREELNCKCFPVNSYLHEVRPDPTELLKGDKKTQAETAQVLIASTVWSPNDARRWMGENPRDGGDEYGNPNTTPGEVKPKPEVEETGATEIDTTQVEDSARRLVSSQARKLCEAERNRLENKAKGRRNFNAFVDAWYGEGDFEQLAADTLTPAVELVAGLMPLADIATALAAHQAASRETLASYVAEAEGPKELAQMIHDWWPVENNTRRIVALLFGEPDEND